MREFSMGIDLGKTHDYTAIAVLEVVRDSSEVGTELRVRHLERLPIGTSYPRQVDRIAALHQAITEPGRFAAQEPPSVQLVVDQTGVGQAVIDLLRGARLPITALTITGGDVPTVVHSQHLRVPKRDLVAALQVVIQSKRLKIAARDPLAQTLLDELLAFRVSINDRGHDSYGNERRSAPHDDLVVALALAVYESAALATLQPGLIVIGRPKAT